ncbi:MAG TPA: hypothetical protein VFV98_03555 [Vicinamibacterales bacterium]|nr:hypothetical protein [Vicinamibacterales bacterium]
MNLKAVGAAIVAVVLSFAIGWIAGAAGRSAAERETARLQLGQDLVLVRAAVLQGRVSLFLINFGDASKQFETARVTAESVQARMRASGDTTGAGKLDAVLASLKDAQRLAASMDQGAQSAADAALKALMSAEK